MDQKCPGEGVGVCGDRELGGDVCSTDRKGRVLELHWRRNRRSIGPVERREFGCDDLDLHVVQTLDVILFRWGVATSLLGQHVDDDGTCPLGGVRKRLLQAGDVMAVDRADVADPERFEERVGCDDLAQGAGQPMDAGVGNLADAR